MKPTRKELLSTLFAFGVLVGIGGIIHFLQERNLVRSHLRSDAVITEVIRLRNSGGQAFIKYRFYPTTIGQNVQSSIHCNFSDKVVSFLRGRRISIVYRPERPGNSRPLLRLEDFRKYSIQPTAYDSSIIMELKKICE